jgi:4-amino-4-deoxy-L-arabinose transferase-like glycosyltransferase
MKRHLHLIIPLLGFFVYGIWIVQGVEQVPFHPDEVSLLYQSRDLELWLTDPRSLTWDSSTPEDYDQLYRALNAPLTKYVLGIGRQLAGHGSETVSIDWDWSLTWEENKAAGAFLPISLLRASRVTVTLLLPVSLLLLYANGRILRSKTTGYAAAILMAANALILLHNRRAMAEGVLTIGVCLAILGMLEADRKPWLAGLGAALATLAKYSCAPLLLVNFVACVWIPSRTQRDRVSIFKNILIYTMVVVVTIFLLSPIAWSDPLEAFTQIWNARQEFVRRQVNTLRHLMPAQVLDTIPLRIAVMTGHLYLSPLQFEEVGNYQSQIAVMRDLYLTNPLHNLLRNPPGGGLLLLATLIGLIAGIHRIVRTPEEKEKRMTSLLLLATALQSSILIIAIPIPYQRYWIPLIPFICLWMANGIEEIMQLITKQAAQHTSSLSDEA